MGEDTIWRLCQISKVRCLIFDLDKEERALGNSQGAVLAQRHQLELMDYVEKVIHLCSAAHKAGKERDEKWKGAGLSSQLERANLDRAAANLNARMERAMRDFE